MSRIQHAALLITGVALFLPVTGCGRNEAKVYEVPKNQPATTPTMMAQGNLPEGHPSIGGGMGMDIGMASARPELKWKTPEGWTENAASQMRVGSFSIKDESGKTADVSIIPLGGRAGGDVANVNRWRGQVGLPDLSAEELQKKAEKVEVADQAAELYDVAGTNPSSGDATRIVGAIQHRDDTAWFFKMTGDAALVEKQKPAFIEFLKSVQFSAPETAQLPPSHPPIGEMGMGSQMTSNEPISSEGKPNWQLPSNWKEVAGGQFLVAKFLIAGEGGAQASVNVSQSAGNGGGVTANVVRWRGQLGLPPSDDVVTTTWDLNGGGKAQMVDLTGTDMRTGQPTRLIGVIVPQSNQTWFYKLMGDAKLVESQKDAFQKFVQSVKY